MQHQTRATSTDWPTLRAELQKWKNYVAKQYKEYEEYVLYWRDYQGSLCSLHEEPYEFQFMSDYQVELILQSVGIVKDEVVMQTKVEKETVGWSHLGLYFDTIVNEHLRDGFTACYRSASGGLRKLDNTSQSLEDFRSDALKLNRSSSVLNFRIMLRRDNTRWTLWARGQEQLLSCSLSPGELTMEFVGKWQDDENIGRVQYFKNLVGHWVPLSDASISEFRQVSFEKSPSSDLDIEFRLWTGIRQAVEDTALKSLELQPRDYSLKFEDEQPFNLDSFFDYAQRKADNNAYWSGSTVLDYKVILTRLTN
ncbi:unnamed protein product [Symbiodinium sp. CCMP2592]|nr:unnamed protein product [Symbiodinium sp. CCMP2592]